MRPTTLGPLLLSSALALAGCNNDKGDSAGSTGGGEEGGGEEGGGEEGGGEGGGEEGGGEDGGGEEGGGDGGDGGDYEALRTPDVVRSSGGTLSTSLTVDYAQHTIGTDDVYLRNYNGELVGPTWRVSPGDRMQFTLTNNLPVSTTSPSHDDAEYTDEYNEPHEFNHTNFHTHGLWVDPVGTEGAWGDNVLIAIEPEGDSATYDIQIPATHPPGTHWYHPHRHGSTALQVSSGMAGFLIIEGGLDDVPEIAAATEHLMLFQQISYDTEDCHDVLPDELAGQTIGCIETYDNMTLGAWERLGRHTTINGQITPQITAAPGELQRWRMLHGGIREGINLAVIKGDDSGALPSGLPESVDGPLDLAELIAAGLEFETLHVIAEDGIAYGRMDEHQTFTMDPGYRVDALVQIEEEGVYWLVDLPAGPTDALHPEAEALGTLMRIVVEGDPVEQDLPAPARLLPLAPYDHIEDSEITGCQKTDFDVGQDLATVNGVAYSHDAPTCKLPLGEAQEWEVSSSGASHPYHIHVNPFEIQRTGAPNIWKDTVTVREGEPLTLRSRYRQFTGKFVMHCHILEHEDKGMMVAMEVMEDPPAIGSDDTSCVPCDD